MWTCSKLVQGVAQPLSFIRLGLTPATPAAQVLQERRKENSGTARSQHVCSSVLMCVEVASKLWQTLQLQFDQEVASASAHSD